MIRKLLKTSLFILLMGLVVVSCKDATKQSMSKEEYQEKVYEQFLKRKEMAKNREKELFSVFEKENLNTEQKDALEFLFAYMPLSDLADYDGEFYLKQVDGALKAREYFNWGKTIPEDIFRHFVLVPRVNNEYLDTARIVFFEELKDRVKGMSMEEAALEVNHWCHEKVNYRGTDGRTSAPLALTKTSWGRCGEESTFAVTAFRSVGIPARQCYTPRWVHSDDNHAWVEVWIDGKWYYLGACEPEPELNVAWFTAPAKRAMMVHTNVFGLYDGHEEKNVVTPLYSVINLLANYANTRKVDIKVIDEAGNPIEGASVKFKVYNYAELYPIARTTSDKDGTASIVSGFGDLMIWANKDEHYGYTKSSANDELTVVVINRKAGENYEETYIMAPPKEQKIKEISQEKIEVNTVRLAQEDSIRNAYMGTFAKELDAEKLAKETNLDKDQIFKYLQLAQGNWCDIQDFIRTEKNQANLFTFLSTLTEKDLRDTPAEYLCDHLQNSNKYSVVGGEVSEDIYREKVLSPRISVELIRPWRSFFQQEHVMKEIIGDERNVNNIINYIKENITINDKENYYNCIITPRGVFELKISDRRSRNVFFVAVCRSLSIPAHVDSATGKPQYYENGQWIDVVFDEEEVKVENNPKGLLTLINDPSNTIKPGYDTHYTIAIFKNGDFQTLDYYNNPLVESFPFTLDLDEGYYRLMAGSRADDGSVMVHAQYFEIKKDAPYTTSVKLPEIIGKLSVKGIVDMNNVAVLNDGSKVSLKTLSNNKGLMICFVDVGKEPSKHILQDLPAQQKELEEWGGGIVMMTPDDKLNNAFNADAFKGLPKQTTWGIDNERKLLNSIVSILQMEFGDNFPLTVYLSSNGEILFVLEGYKIGIGENILKTIVLEREALCSK
jgi:hypothetical protein